jgi:hypothetical protein
MNAISSRSKPVARLRELPALPGGERIALLRLTALSSGPAEGPNSIKTNMGRRSSRGQFLKTCHVSARRRSAQTPLNRRRLRACCLSNSTRVSGFIPLGLRRAWDHLGTMTIFPQSRNRSHLLLAP